MTERTRLRSMARGHDARAPQTVNRRNAAHPRELVPARLPEIVTPA
jgi:hypothetical protein